MFEGIKKIGEAIKSWAETQEDEAKENGEKVKAEFAAKLAEVKAEAKAKFEELEAQIAAKTSTDADEDGEDEKATVAEDSAADDAAVTTADTDAE